MLGQCNFLQSSTNNALPSMFITHSFHAPSDSLLMCNKSVRENGSKNLQSELERNQPQSCFFTPLYVFKIISGAVELGSTKILNNQLKRLLPVFTDKTYKYKVKLKVAHLIIQTLSTVKSLHSWT